MAGDEELRGNAPLDKGRMEALSDGVVAIAITLLVLDLAVRPPGAPLHQFLAAWPSYLAYLVSFLTIGAAWIAHHGFTNRLARVDPILLRLNLLFLLVLSFLPFPTGLVAEALERTASWERVGAVVYGLTLLVVRLLFAAERSYAQRRSLWRPYADDPDLRDARRKFRYVVSAYVVTILLGLVVPIAAITLYFAIAVFMIVPFRSVGRMVFRRRPS